MSLHHLDPRRAGTGAEPDVETRLVYDMENNRERWHWADTDGDDCCHPIPLGGYLTESAALAAARAAAGFGHVAERACDDPVYADDIDQEDAPEWAHGPMCCQCAWSRDAHVSVPA